MMPSNFKKTSVLLSLSLFLLLGCGKEKRPVAPETQAANTIRHASGLSIVRHEGYSVVTVSSPWPGAEKPYVYVLKEKDGTVPESLSDSPVIPVPVHSIVVTSTTHIPSLEMLGVENTLTGFPETDYISSEKTRARIESGKVRELGGNRNLNFEATLDLGPDVVIGNGIDDNNPAYHNLQKAGIPVMLNGDWNEKTPLGRAEWIKFFGALYGLGDKADILFLKIEKDYRDAQQLAASVSKKPTVLVGALYENTWNLPQGDSWGALFIKDAGGRYLWADSRGTGSLTLPFEQVFEKAKDADFWIGPGQYTTLAEMEKDTPHHTRFAPYKNKTIYSFSAKKGKTGGLLYYELAPNRPDLVLKDLVSILHPELLPGYRPVFFEKLQ